MNQSSGTAVKPMDFKLEVRHIQSTLQDDYTKYAHSPIPTTKRIYEPTQDNKKYAKL